MELNDVEKRINMEQMIVLKVVEDALAAGYELQVDDGESLTEGRLLTPTQIVGHLMATDESNLLFVKDGKRVGFVFFVFGNDGYDVICDNSLSLEDVLQGATDLADSLEAAC